MVEYRDPLQARNQADLMSSVPPEPAARRPQTEMPESTGASNSASAQGGNGQSTCGTSPADVGARGSSVSPPEADKSVFGWERGDRRFVSVVASIALVLMAVHWWRITGWSPAPVEVDRPAGDAYRFILDINSATWVEWMQLEGIGEILARRIVADREQRGPFASIDEIERVPGIGPKTLQKMRPYLTVLPADARPFASEIQEREPSERGGSARVSPSPDDIQTTDELKD